MVYIKETDAKKVGFNLVLVFIVSLALIVLALSGAIISGSPSLLAFAGTLIFIESTITAALIGFYLGRRNQVGLSKTSALLSAVFLAIGLLLIIYSSFLIYRAVGDTIKIVHYEIALPTPLLTILITYIMSEFFERRLPEEHWRAGRVIGDRIRGAISSASIAIVGPSIAFFGIPSLEPIFAIFVILYGLVEANRTLREILYVRKKDDLTSSLEEIIERTFKALPAVLNAKADYLETSGKFIVASLSAHVSNLIETKFVDDIGDFMYTELLSKLGTIIFLRVEIQTIEPDLVYLALPVSNDNKLGTFPDGTIKIIAVDPKTGNTVSEEKLELKFDDSEKIPYARAVEIIAKRGVNFILAKDFNLISRNATRHWFIQEVKMDIEDINGAIEEFKKRIVADK